MRIAVLILLIAATSPGATYYVRTDGSDANPGTANTAGGAWLTQQKAWNTMAAGDTTIVQPGYYDRASGFDASSVGGTPSQRITMQAATAGTVTNKYGVSIRHSWITYDGFTFDGTNVFNITPLPWKIETFGGNDSGSWISVRGDPANGFNPTNVVVQNCRLWGVHQGEIGISFAGHPITGLGDYFHTNGPQFCVLSNCIMSDYDCSAQGPVEVVGMSNTIVRLTMTNGLANWAIALWGWYNTYDNCYVDGVYGTIHPDLFQVFMTGGAVQNPNPNNDSYGYTIKNCYFRNFATLGEFEYYPCLTNGAGMTPTLFGGHTWANCVFENGQFPGSMNIPGLSFINCTFLNASCSFQFYDPTCWSRLDQFEYPGSATNLTVLNNLFISSGFTYQVDTNFSKPLGLVEDYNVFLTLSAGGAWSAGSFTPTTNLNFSTYTTNFTACGSPSGGPSYYNVIQGYRGAHDINTGADPKLVGGSTWAGITNVALIATYRPMSGSPCIDAGTNAAAFTTSDIESMSRPFGSAYDIGAFEFDPACRAHYDWSTDFITGQTVTDVTGYGHPIYNMENGTNWLTLTNGPTGRAGQGYTNGTIVGGDSATYTLGCAGVMTNNIADLTNLTSGSISFWVRWATNAERRDRVFDCGYAPTVSLNAAAATNSWMIQYGSSSTSYDPTCTGPSFYVWTAGDNNSTNSMIYYWTNELRDGVTWFMNTVTWTGGSNVLCYQNGSLVYSNYFQNSALVFDGAVSPKWLAFGVYQHEEPPTWRPGVSFADTGFWKSTIGDTRIWNRQLSSTEVANLFTGSGSALAGSPAGPVASTSAGVSLGAGTIKLGSGTISQ